VAKCIVKAALEPPAAIPHKERREALMHSVYSWKGMRDVARRENGKIVASTGDVVSRTIAASLRMSARKRYVLASGKREEPR